MILQFKKMGLARNIADKARKENRKNRETYYRFNEREFRKFVYYLSREQKCICGQSARENLSPMSSGKFAADIVESAPDVEV